MSGPDDGDVWVIGVIIAIVGVVGGAIARDRAMARQNRDADDKLHERINRMRDDHQVEMRLVRQELTDYKLQVAREYASVDHLKEVETRLVSAIKELTAELKGMPAQLAQVIQRSKEG